LTLDCELRNNKILRDDCVRRILFERQDRSQGEKVGGRDLPDHHQRNHSSRFTALTTWISRLSSSFGTSLERGKQANRQSPSIKGAKSSRFELFLDFFRCPHFTRQRCSTFDEKNSIARLCLSDEMKPQHNSSESFIIHRTRWAEARGD
jgi:hypothetical protein